MKVQSFSDIITNSSSELFVFNDGRSVNDTIKLLDNIYPNWVDEYFTPDYVSNTNEADQENYFDFRLYYECNERAFHNCIQNISPKTLGEYYTFSTTPIDKKNCHALHIAKQIGLTPKETFENWEHYNPNTDWHPQFTRLACKRMAELEPDTVLLFSKEENPDYGMQEILLKYALKYHLG